MESLKWIFRYVKKYRVRYGIALGLVLMVSAINMINPMISGRIVDEVMQGGKKQLLLPLLGMMLLVVIVKSVIVYTYQMIFEYVSQDIIFEIREQCYAKLMTLDFDYYNHSRTGDLMARLTGDTDAIRHFIAWVLYTIFSHLSVFLIASIYMYSLSPILTICMVSITPVIAILTIRMTKEVGPTFHAVREAFSRVNSIVEENISGNRVVKAFTRESFEIEKFDVENSNYKTQNLKSSQIWQKYLPLLDSSSGTLSVILVLVGGILVIKGQMTLGDLVVFNGLIWALNNPMRNAGWLVNDVQRFVAAADKIKELLDATPRINIAVPGRVPDEIKGEITFENVSFNYNKEDVLKNISFTIKPGQTVGVIGPTGSGKTTLLNLLYRFYDVGSGSIKIDGINIKELDLKSYRNQLGIAMQDVFLFSDTIEDNIAYGDTSVHLTDVQRVAHVADAHDFVERLPQQYETIVGERGVGLSGGQKQRLSLARALLKNPSILILDDTTSAVDMETEFKIQQGVSQYLKKRTNFIIAHRISSVKSADIILVLVNGKIIEKGSHQELMNQKGYYYDVYQTQFGDLEQLSERLKKGEGA